VPVTVNTTEPPTGRLTVAARLLVPDPVAPLVTLALPEETELQLTLVRAAGMVSATLAPTASLGPVLVTVMV
jgi:hypothetical protein